MKNPGLVNDPPVWVIYYSAEKPIVGRQGLMKMYNFYMPKLSPDEKWKRFNHELEEQMKISDFYGLGTTYYMMAEYIKKEGKDSSTLRQKGYEMNLVFHRNELSGQYSSEFIAGVEILSSLDCCDRCQMVNGVKLKVREALLKNLIPVKDCSHKYGCRCTYAPVID